MSEHDSHLTRRSGDVVVGRVGKRVVEFRGQLPKPSILSFMWRECQPHLLVVTDGLNYRADHGFGLTQFVETLRSSNIHGMSPRVTTAALPGIVTPNADISSFAFEHPDHGVVIGRYDVVFLFGVRQEPSAIGPAAINALARFMQNGGGVFATGDHEDLGAGMCMNIPRVRSMRYWAANETPDVADTTRLSTNLPGDDGAFAFNDQSDRHPQRLYANYRSNRSMFVQKVSKVRSAHALLQMPGGGTIDVFPDHPHEGECRLPEDLGSSFQLDGSSLPEWPPATGLLAWLFGPSVPVGVASTMSFGNGFDSGPTRAKEALSPRSFMAIAAYNGHRSGVGRVATDATWHHFININLDGTGSGSLTGLVDPGPPASDSPDLAKVRQYFVNLGSWLMPAKTRRCLRSFQLLVALNGYPLFEEARVPFMADATAEELITLGQMVAAAVARVSTADEAEQFALDAIGDAFGDREFRQLADVRPEDMAEIVSEIAHASLGAVTAVTLERFLELTAELIADSGPLDQPDSAKELHRVFEQMTAEAGGAPVRRAVSMVIDRRRKIMRASEMSLELLASATVAR
jgi:hypothetical protein